MMVGLVGKIVLASCAFYKQWWLSNEKVSFLVRHQSPSLLAFPSALPRMARSGDSPSSYLNWYSQLIHLSYIHLLFDFTILSLILES